jgi:GTP-binding protein HflX
VTGQGVDALQAALEARLALDRTIFDVAITPDDGASLSWLYENGEVTNRSTAADGTVLVTVRVVRERAERLRNRFQSQITDVSSNEARVP